MPVSMEQTPDGCFVSLFDRLGRHGLCSSLWFYSGNNFSWVLATGIKFVRGHLQKAVFYCGGIDEAQCFYKCFMLSRLQFSTETKKESVVVKPTVVVPQFSPAPRLSPFLPFPVTSPLSSRAGLTLHLSVIFSLSLSGPQLLPR